MAGLDFDPFLDKQEWDDRPAREAVDVEEKHDETKLDKKLRNRSFDNRKTLAGLQVVVGGVITLAVIACVVWVVWAGFSYAFL